MALDVLLQIKITRVIRGLSQQLERRLLASICLPELHFGLLLLLFELLKSLDLLQFLLLDHRIQELVAGIAKGPAPVSSLQGVPGQVEDLPLRCFDCVADLGRREDQLVLVGRRRHGLLCSYETNKIKNQKL